MHKLKYAFKKLYVVLIYNFPYFFSGSTRILHDVQFHLSHYLVCLSLHPDSHVLEQAVISMSLHSLWSSLLQKTKNFSQVNQVSNYRHSNALDVRIGTPTGHRAVANPSQSINDNQFTPERIQVGARHRFFDSCTVVLIPSVNKNKIFELDSSQGLH